MKSYYVPGSQGTALYVVETGNSLGEPILFIHGFSQSHFVWWKQLHSQQLKEEFRLVAFDLRGHGLSEKKTDGYHHSSCWAEDLHVFGDQALKGIHFVSGIPGPEKMGEEWLKLQHFFVEDSMERHLAGLKDLIHVMMERPLDETSFAFWYGQASLTPSFVRKELMAKPSERRDYRTIDVPILVSHGLSDRITLPGIEQALHLFPHASASLYPHTGHAPFWEQPERFNEELIQFARSFSKNE